MHSPGLLAHGRPISAAVGRIACHLHSVEPPSNFFLLVQLLQYLR